MSIAIEADDLESFLATIPRTMSEHIAEFLTDKAAPRIAQSVLQNFATESEASGTPWPERKDNLPHPLLNLSGALMSAATSSGGANHIEEVADNTLTFGVRGGEGGIIYAGRQNYGDVPGSRDSLGRPMNIPAREYMAIDEETADDIAGDLADMMASVFAGD